MTPNAGPVDRLLRTVAGLLLMGLASTGALGGWAYLGVLPLVTGLVGVCPAYRLLGVDTLPRARPR